MPRGDGTGPMGMGPMTGRAAGYCAGYGVPGYANPISGGGFWGRGGGMGRGRRNWFRATGMPGWQRAGYGYPAFGGVAAYAPPYVPPVAAGPTKEQELDALKGQAEYFERALEQLKQRMDELEGQD